MVKEVEPVSASVPHVTFPLVSALRSQDAAVSPSTVNPPETILSPRKEDVALPWIKECAPSLPTMMVDVAWRAPTLVVPEINASPCTESGFVGDVVLIPKEPSCFKRRSVVEAAFAASKMLRFVVVPKIERRALGVVVPIPTLSVLVVV